MGHGGRQAGTRVPLLPPAPSRWHSRSLVRWPVPTCPHPGQHSPVRGADARARPRLQGASGAWRGAGRLLEPGGMALGWSACRDYQSLRPPSTHSPPPRCAAGRYLVVGRRGGPARARPRRPEPRLLGGPGAQSRVLAGQRPRPVGLRAALRGDRRARRACGRLVLVRRWGVLAKEKSGSAWCPQGLGATEGSGGTRGPGPSPPARTQWQGNTWGARGSRPGLPQLAGPARPPNPSQTVWAPRQHHGHLGLFGQALDKGGCGGPAQSYCSERRMLQKCQVVATHGRGKKQAFRIRANRP